MSDPTSPAEPQWRWNLSPVLLHPHSSASGEMGAGGGVEVHHHHHHDDEDDALLLEGAGQDETFNVGEDMTSRTAWNGVGQRVVPKHRQQLPPPPPPSSSEVEGDHRHHNHPFFADFLSSHNHYSTTSSSTAPPAAAPFGTSATEDNHYCCLSDEDYDACELGSSVPQSEPLYRCTNCKVQNESAAALRSQNAPDGPSILTATRGGVERTSGRDDSPPAAPRSLNGTVVAAQQPHVELHPPYPPPQQQQLLYVAPHMMIVTDEQPQPYGDHTQPAAVMYVTQPPPHPYAAAGPPMMYPYPTPSPYPTAHAPYAPPPHHQPYYHQPTYMPVAYPPPPPQMYYVDPHTGAMHAMGHPHYAPQQPSYPTMMMGMSATTPDPPQGSEGTAAAPQPPSLEQSESVAAVSVPQKSAPTNPPLLSPATAKVATGATQQANTLSTATSTTARSRATAAVAAASSGPTAKKRASSADGRATAAAAVPHVPSFSLVPRPRDVGPTAVPVVLAVEQQQQPSAQERPAEEHPPPPLPSAAKAVPSSSSLEAVKGEMLLEQYLSAMGDPAAVRRWRHIRNVQGHVAVFAKNQAGSRLLQHILEDDAAAAVPVVFEELRAAGLHTVMMDFTGSFLLKKLVDVAPRPMAAAMFEQLRPHFLELSLHATACRVVQHMICHRDALRHHLAMVAEALCGSVVRCVTDANASHLVQKLISAYPAWGQKVAEELAADRLDTVACHAHGSRVLQRLFEQFTHQANVPATPISDVHAALAASGGGAPGAPLSTISERARRAMGVDLLPLAHHIARNARQYVFNQYGNHSVLAAMANVPPPLQRRFVEELLPLLPRLLRSSVALSVVECLFTLLTEDECTQAVGVLCEGNPPPVVWMLQDAHAQPIVKGVLDREVAAHRERIMAAAKGWVSGIGRSSHGKYLLKKLGLDSDDGAPAGLLKRVDVADGAGLLQTHWKHPPQPQLQSDSCSSSPPVSHSINDCTEVTVDRLSSFRQPPPPPPPPPPPVSCEPPPPPAAVDFWQSSPAVGANRAQESRLPRAAVPGPVGL